MCSLVVSVASNVLKKVSFAYPFALSASFLLDNVEAKVDRYLDRILGG